MVEAWVYKGFLALVFVGLLGAVGWDLVFYFTGHTTISMWLRSRPDWFLIPAALLLVLVGVLMLHLFGRS